jgi:chemotaxis protein CheD
MAEMSQRSGQDTQEQTLTIRIAEMGLARSTGAPSILKTTLGSCVGVILSDPVNGIHGLAHVMLPERLGKDKATGKYADTAVPALVAAMERSGATRRTMEAFLVGGASMFQSPESSCLPRIGEKNVETVRRVLGELGIPIVFQETGGTAGRTVIFDCADRVPRVKTLNGVSQP